MDSRDKIRIRICLTHAEIVLRISDGEPLRIIKKSIARTPLPDLATRETVKTTNRRALGKVKTSASLTKLPSIAVDAGVSGSGQVDITDKSTEIPNRYLAQHFQTQDGDPAQEVSSPDTEAHLDCAPWDAQKSHRLKLRRETERNADGDRPSVNVEVRCRREDIRIEDLAAKDVSIQNSWLSRPNPDANLAATEQSIKDELLKAGFMKVGNLAEGFTEILIADAILTEDWYCAKRSMPSSSGSKRWTRRMMRPNGPRDWAI